MNLELMAMRFLRYEKSCPVALLERSPRSGIGQPDVLGITHARYLLEIEIKRSFSDFRANERKRHIRGYTLEPERYSPKRPKQFWYLVPAELSPKVAPFIPEWAGLMRGPMGDEWRGVTVMKPAPSNPASLRLTLRECATLMHCAANQILSQQTQIAMLTGRETEPYDWFWQI